MNARMIITLWICKQCVPNRRQPYSYLILVNAIKCHTVDKSRSISVGIKVAADQFVIARTVSNAVSFVCRLKYVVCLFVLCFPVNNFSATTLPT